jgi:hypothetical protein
MYYAFSASTDFTTKANRLRAYSVTETAGVAAIENIRAGSVTGPIVFQLRFAAVTGGSTQVGSFDHPRDYVPGGRVCREERRNDPGDGGTVVVKLGAVTAAASGRCAPGLP